MTNNYIPIHFSIHDASGESAVFEFLNGNTRRQWQPNSVRMLTNAPPSPGNYRTWGDYVGLAPVDAAQRGTIVA